MTKEIPCWNCDGEMKQLAPDSFYDYYKCPKCGARKTILKDDYPGKTEGVKQC